MLTPKVSYLGPAYPAGSATRGAGAKRGTDHSEQRLPARQLDRNRRRSARAAVDARVAIQ
jgi:hypothetical protein